MALILIADDSPTEVFILKKILESKFFVMFEKVIEAVRQMRGEAHPSVQVPNCQISLAHGTGGSLGSKHGSVTLILGQEDA